MDAKAPMLFSPRWFWMVLKCITNPKFHRDVWKDPEKQATWQTSSAATAVQIAAGAHLVAWLELHAPWVVTIFATIWAGIKAVIMFIVYVIMAVVSVATNS